MLVQKQKSKKQRAALFNKIGSSPPQNISSAMIAGFDAHIANDDKNESYDEHIDEKYRDFHRNRQSEKVLRVIRSVLEENRGTFTKSTTNTNEIANAAIAIEGKKEESTGKAPDEQQVSILNELKTENENLKSQLCLVYDYLNSSTTKTNTKEEGHEASNITMGECEAGKHNGVVGASAPCGDCKTLRNLVTQLKIDCLQERTEKEMLRLNVLKLNECFGAVKQEYDTLQDKLTTMESSCNKRLNRADDDIHRIKHCANKKKSFFRKLF